MINASLTYFTPINNWLGRLLINKRLSLNIGETSLICSKIIFCHCFKGWLLTRNSQESEFLLTLFDKIFDDLYHYINTTLSPKMETLQCNQIMQVKCKLKNKDNWWRNENIAIHFLWKICWFLKACNLLEGLIPKKDDKGTLPAFHLEKLFIFALMWSLGALLELDDRAKMEEFLSKHPSALDLPPIKEGETIFEYVVDDHGIWTFFITVKLR